MKVVSNSGDIGFVRYSDGEGRAGSKSLFHQKSITTKYK